MAQFEDRRSGKGKGRDAGQNVDQPAPRRVAPGVRNTSQFFGGGNLHREMTRGDFLRVFAMQEYHRRERRWWNRLSRFIRGLPQVPDMCGEAAKAHERELGRIYDQLLAQHVRAQAQDHQPEPMSNKMAPGFKETPPDDRG